MRRYSEAANADVRRRMSPPHVAIRRQSFRGAGHPEVGAFYWTVLDPEIVKSRRKGLGSLSELGVLRPFSRPRVGHDPQRRFPHWCRPVVMRRSG
jgi:hypothetical protein